MKVWELEEGVEYVSSLSDGETKYQLIDGDLYYMNPSINYGSYMISGMEYNRAKETDFTLYTPPTDWSKVEVDTKVLCLCSDGTLVKRHFAKYENGSIYTWSYGTTQFTHDESYGMTKWTLESVKLYTE